MSEEDWKWFGNAGHLCVGQSCRFHLATKVGKYLVSTVGQYWPERSVREIHAKVHDHEWLDNHGHLKGDDFDAAYMIRFGYQEIGCDRKFETMVFLAGNPCAEKECACGLPSIDSSELDCLPANDPQEAKQNHMRLCAKWSKKP